MAEKNEHLLFHYLHDKRFNQDDQNVIGATDDLLLRTITAHTDLNSIYVKKFGTDYAIGDITGAVIANPRSDGPGVNKWVYVFKNENGTTLGRVKDENGVSTFIDGTAEASERIRVEVCLNSGTISTQDGDTISLTTDVDAPLVVYLPAVSGAGPDLLLSLSESGSTYYMNGAADNSMIYGGYRHTPDSTSKYPYFDINTAVQDPDATGFTITTVLDSETYDEEIDMTVSGMILQAALGETPTITSGIGARVTREVSTQYNNGSAIYFNENGDDANNGKWLFPKLTPGAAITARAGRAVVYGGVGANPNSIFSVAAPLIVAAFVFESDYGYNPTIKTSTTSEVFLNQSGIIRGIIIDGNNIYWGVSTGGVVFDITLYDCTVQNCTRGIELGRMLNIITQRCIFQDCQYGMWSQTLAADPLTWGITDCIFRNNTTSGIEANNGTRQEGNIDNNIFYNNNQGLRIGINQAFFSMDNNIFFNNTYGIFLTTGNWGGSIDNCIFHTNTNHGLSSNFAITVNYNNYYNNGTDYSGLVTNVNIITGDPKLCKITSPYKLGLSSDSPCFKADGSENDTGPAFRNILISNDDIEINGFIMDGQEQCFNAIGTTGATDYSGMIIKWNTIFDYQGISKDIYSGSDTNAIINNNNINNNGNGIKLSRGGNSLQENLIYVNSIFGLYMDYTVQVVNHNVFYNNQYGVNLFSNSGSIIYKNNISFLNSLYGIFSEVPVAITYNCIVDAINNIDISDASNIINEPLFINTDLGDEDFHIKTTEANPPFIHDSPCKDSSDDIPVKDIGAYDVSRSVESESYKKYQLESNPRDMDDFEKLKNNSDITNGPGSLKRYAVAKKRVFPLQYADNDLQTRDQKDTLQYLSLLVPGINGLTEDRTTILFHILPSQKLFNGTAAVISATAKTIDDILQEWSPDRFRGFWAAVKFTSGTDLVIDATAKTGTKAGAGWTIDEWAGYFFYHNFYYYRILSNTATVLTLSDPDDTLLDETAATYAIEKYFLILSNSKNQLLLDDPDDELISGSFDCYIDFIKVQSTNKQFKPKQDGYFFQKFHQKTGFSVSFEEK